MYQSQQQQPANAWQPADGNGVSLDSNGQNFLIDGITRSLTNDVLPQIVSPDVGEDIRQTIWAGAWDGSKYPLHNSWNQIDAYANPPSGVNFIQAGITLDNFSQPDEGVIFLIGKEGVLKNLRLRDDDENAYPSPRQVEKDLNNTVKFTQTVIRKACKDFGIARKKGTEDEKKASKALKERQRWEHSTDTQKASQRERKRLGPQKPRTREEKNFNNWRNATKNKWPEVADVHFAMLCEKMSEVSGINLNPMVVDYEIYKTGPGVEKTIGIYANGQAILDQNGIALAVTDTQARDDWKLKPYLLTKFDAFNKAEARVAVEKKWGPDVAASALGGLGLGSGSDQASFSDITEHMGTAPGGHVFDSSTGMPGQFQSSGLPFPSSMVQYQQMGNDPQLGQPGGFAQGGYSQLQPMPPPPATSSARQQHAITPPPPERDERRHGAKRRGRS